MKKILLSISCLYVATIMNSQTEFWGLTRDGGANSMGTIFKTDGAGNSQTLIYDFVNATGGLPQGSLIKATDGKLYGLTTIGGLSYGVLFQIDPITNTYTKKINFNDTNGDTPKGSLMQASDGKIYGMTFYGGSSSGVLFQYDPITNILIKKVTFNITNGSHPAGELIQATDGKLYGMTKDGGVNGKGVLFQYDPSTNVYVKKIDFATTVTGSNPLGSLTQAADGKLYGMTYAGGVNNFGVIFQYDPITNTLTKKFDFPTAAEGSPLGSLTIATDGKLYGLAQWNLFQYDFNSNVYAQKIDFSSTSSGPSLGSLVQASDGNLYGMTTSNLFQYNITTNTLNVKFTFSGGVNPNGALLEIVGSTVDVKKALNNQLSFSIYPNPTAGILNIKFNFLNESPVNINITNALGQVVLTESVTTQNSTLNIKNLDAGMYFVNVTDSKGNKAVQKIIKE